MQWWNRTLFRTILQKQQAEPHLKFLKHLQNLPAQHPLLSSVFSDISPPQPASPGQEKLQSYRRPTPVTLCGEQARAGTVTVVMAAGIFSLPAESPQGVPCQSGSRLVDGEPIHCHCFCLQLSLAPPQLLPTALDGESQEHPGQEQQEMGLPTPKYIG